MNFMLMKKIVVIKEFVGDSFLVVLLFDFQYNFRFASCIQKLTSNLMPYYGYKQKNYSLVS